MAESTESRRPIELVGVYHADGGLLGELRYVLGKARGTTHCALCDITHTTVRRKAEWDAASREYSLPIRLVHLNERSTQEINACTLGTPTLLAHYDDDTWQALLGPSDLEVDGSVPAFFAAVDRALAHR
jgi:hypothetical protein